MAEEQKAEEQKADAAEQSADGAAAPDDGRIVVSVQDQSGRADFHVRVKPEKKLQLNTLRFVYDGQTVSLTPDRTVADIGLEHNAQLQVFLEQHGGAPGTSAHAWGMHR
ncbi:hypothetical protein JKP88DRAFT_262084 [Tribonema minus]|uniref:Ubiquitin-like domain-containing protein n=1 Tax=Tribonema minus TaxID=303371 RepID=A0A835ZC75_9STRA|nr:hypothetical protein JKP88DRAFT_262084 [Tribonema minus]